MIEAALFVSSKPLTVEEISDVIHLPRKEVKAVLDSMNWDYGNRGIELYYSEIRGTYELKVKEKYRASVSRLAPYQDLSRGMLQTLSVIAYKNPVRQSKVVAIRGNRAYEHLAELEEKGFIWRESKGHSQMIHITRKFLDYFGLETIDELKLYFQNMPIVEKFLDEDHSVKKAVEDVPATPGGESLSDPVKIGGLDPKIRREVEKRKKELGIMTLEEEDKNVVDDE